MVSLWRIVHVRSHHITICKAYKGEVYHSFKISPSENTTLEPPAPATPPLGPLLIAARSTASSLTSVTLPGHRGVGIHPFFTFHFVGITFIYNLVSWWDQQVIVAMMTRHNKLRSLLPLHLERAWIHFKGFSSSSSIFSNDLIGYIKTIYLESSCDWITLAIHHNVGLFRAKYRAECTH